MTMSGMARRLFSVAGFVSLGMALIGAIPPASAQDAVRIRGTVERIEGPVYAVKNRDGAELKLTLTDNPLFVVIIPSKMTDIKQGLFVGSAGMMQADGVQKAIEVHIFPESMRSRMERCRRRTSPMAGTARRRRSDRLAAADVASALLLDLDIAGFGDGAPARDVGCENL
jgi:hypothetical protein